jgi:hypothetical protein
VLGALYHWPILWAIIVQKTTALRVKNAIAGNESIRFPIPL